jgi:Tfp pilus assembly protein PilX
MSFGPLSLRGRKKDRRQSMGDCGIGQRKCRSRTANRRIVLIVICLLLVVAVIIFVGNMRDQQRRAMLAHAAAQHAAQVGARLATVEDTIVDAQHAADTACSPLFSGLRPLRWDEERRPAVRSEEILHHRPQ